MSSDIYRRLKSELDNGKKAAVVTLIDNSGDGTGSSCNKILFTAERLRTSEMTAPLDSATADKVSSALETGTLQYLRIPDSASILIEPYFPQPRLIVLGGGHIAKPLVEFGSRVGFLVSVIDDRPVFANRDRFPDAEKVICENFRSSFTQFELNEYSFVVIVTREHRHDLDCLREVLNHKTAYTGMIGSKRSVSSIKEQLLSEGYSAELINRIHAPVGLEIGADTPEEIAISIIAQVIGCRRLACAAADQADRTDMNWPVLERPVLEELCRDAGGPKALITIIETEGSVPRRAGTKMLVWPYGMTLGSIGGGYAEGEAINTAWQVIGSGAPKIHDIDMTGQIAEEEGMVCGGVMRILIEDYTG